METIYLGDRKISIRTSVLEEKATACNMLCCYADELKDGFYPWVEQARIGTCGSQPPALQPCLHDLRATRGRAPSIDPHGVSDWPSCARWQA